MDQDSTWIGGGPWPDHIVLDGEPASVPKKGAEPPQFSAHFYSARNARICNARIASAGTAIPSVRLSVRLSSILITANIQSETGFPSSHQLKSYVASKSRLKLAARFALSCQRMLAFMFVTLWKTAS